MRLKILTTAAATAAAAALAVGAGAPAQAATPGSPNDRLVQKWYADVLGRAADEGMDRSGRAYWVDRLDAGEDPRRILTSVLSSAEFADDTVDGIYEEHLGRSSAGDRGATYWTSGIRGDMEPEWVEQNVLASAEYDQRAGDQRVERWYRAVLGRTGDAVTTAGERSYWQGRIGAVGALNAVREVWYSSEAVSFRIRDAYADVLDRERVSNGEIDYWYDRAFDSDLGLRTDLALSAEYGPRGSATDPAPPVTPAPPAPPTPAPAQATGG